MGYLLEIPQTKTQLRHKETKLNWEVRGHITTAPSGSLFACLLLISAALSYALAAVLCLLRARECFPDSTPGHCVQVLIMFWLTQSHSNLIILWKENPIGSDKLVDWFHCDLCPHFTYQAVATGRVGKVRWCKHGHLGSSFSPGYTWGWVSTPSVIIRINYILQMMKLNWGKSRNYF